jgi:hypothetical protein
MFEIDVTKGNLKEQFMCEKCYDDESGEIRN